jgi:hypothetical protein
LNRVIATSKLSDTQFHYDIRLSTTTEVDLPPGQYDVKATSPNIEIKIPDDLEREERFTTISSKAQIYEITHGNILSFVFIMEKMNKIWLTKKADTLNRPVYHVEVIGNVAIFNPSR